MARVHRNTWAQCKNRRHAVLGRRCGRCERGDDEVRWSNRRDRCGSCEKQGRHDPKPPELPRPSVEEKRAYYQKTGGLRRFQRERDTDDDLGTLAG